MTPRTFILMGRSGCGKGTQGKMLRDFITAHDDEQRKVFYLETGERFREFIKGKSFSSKLAGEINNMGASQPAFLAVWNWAHLMVEELTGEEHVFVDGTPRSFQEALVFDSAVTFYGRNKPVVIYIDVSKEWSKERLVARAGTEGRVDDQKTEQIDNRLSWFDTDVVPAIDYFRVNGRYRYLHINGEQPIEKVHADIIAELGRSE
ncbi:MAG: nucleoside monophosphate kinase [Patescibacteria group bacterium]